MGIGKYIKEIGRGKDGARALTRAGRDLWGQLLDGTAPIWKLAPFAWPCASRAKRRTKWPVFWTPPPSASHRCRPAPGQPTVVIPSYNGARKLPLLTPLLALLLAREGLPVLIHGTATESTRVFTSEVLAALGIPAQAAIQKIANGEVAFVPTALLSPGLQRLLEVRRVVNLRNPAHSLVKLMNPCEGPA
jgi:anthranilate phosphoribosyltransferase